MFRNIKPLDDFFVEGPLASLDNKIRHIFGMQIPKDWKIIKLGDYVIIETGKRSKGGALNHGKVASIGGEHIDNQGRIIWTNMKFIPEDFYNNLKQGKVRSGDILLVKDGATTGKVAFVKELLYSRAAVNEHVFIIRSNRKNKLLNEYLFYVLYSKIGQNQIRMKFHGMIGGIRRKELKEIIIPLPSIEEQCRIVEVLSTVDEAIRLVDESIIRTERLKKGLMQELLTKGIGHKEFKQTEIGKIPKEWKIVRLENITRKIIDSPHKMPKRISKGYPFVSVNYVLQFADYNFYIDPNMDGLEYIPRDQYEEFRKRFDVDKGDIIYTKWGTPGVAKLVNTSEKFIGSCSIALIKAKKEVIYPLFLVYMLNSSIVKCQIIPYSHTTTRTEIHIGHIKRIKVPLPLLQEQKKIAEILSTIDKRLEFERKKKAKLQKIKQGLMDLLLTGKIRVKVRK